MKCYPILWLVFMSLYLFSCSASRRFLTLVKNHPELVDTSLVRDTLFLKGKDSVSIVKQFERFDSLFTLYKDTCVNSKPVRISNPVLKKQITNLIRAECGLSEGVYLSNNTKVEILKAKDGHYYLVAEHKEVVYKPNIIHKVGGIQWVFKYWYLFVIAAMLGYILPKILFEIIKSFI